MYKDAGNIISDSSQFPRRSQCVALQSAVDHSEIVEQVSL